MGSDALGARLRLYQSQDLRAWEFDRIIYRDPNPDVYMLECPDLFPLGDRWVLLCCPMGLQPDAYLHRNGHNAGYVVGAWEPGGVFEPTTEYRPLDWGHNYYAPQTFGRPTAGGSSSVGWGRSRCPWPHRPTAGPVSWPCPAS